MKQFPIYKWNSFCLPHCMYIGRTVLIFEWKTKIKTHKFILRARVELPLNYFGEQVRTNLDSNCENVQLQAKWIPVQFVDWHLIEKTLIWFVCGIKMLSRWKIKSLSLHTQIKSQFQFNENSQQLIGLLPFKIWINDNLCHMLQHRIQLFRIQLVNKT